MSYIQLNRESKKLEWLMRKRPSALMLLILIAKRAKRSVDHPDINLDMGEAEVGDFETYGVTRQIYRTDLDYLIFNQLVTTKTTNRGTIAKLVDTDIFNINEEQLTTSSSQIQPTTNQQLTTNKNDNNDNKEKEVLVNQLKPMDEDELHRFGIKHKIWVDEVRAMQETVLLKIESGWKNRQGEKIKNLKLTVLQWLKNNISRGELTNATDIEMQMMQLRFKTNKELYGY